MTNLSQSDARVPDHDTLNREFYQSKEVAEWYGTKAFILPEEAAFLRDFASEFQGKLVLDAGIGAGRSTRFLLPLAGQYIGFDYASDMVDQARRLFPEAQLEVRDARDLSAYDNGQFDLVLFSFNGLDCLSHEGRLGALREIRRVIKPGGLFAFSSHNRERMPATPFAWENISFSRNPFIFVENLRLYFKGIRNWWKTRHLAHETPEYAQRHDCGNVFQIPAYYITKVSQSAQLAREGFKLEAIFDRQGHSSTTSSSDLKSSWIFYVARAMDT